MKSPYPLLLLYQTLLFYLFLLSASLILLFLDAYKAYSFFFLSLKVTYPLNFIRAIENSTTVL